MAENKGFVKRKTAELSPSRRLSLQRPAQAGTGVDDLLSLLHYSSFIEPAICSRSSSSRPRL